MDQLMHNEVIRITAGEHAATYRVIFDEPRKNCTVLVRIASAIPTLDENKGNGIAHRSKTRLSRSFIGALIWLERETLEQLHADGEPLLSGGRATQVDARRLGERPRRRAFNLGAGPTQRLDSLG